MKEINIRYGTYTAEYCRSTGLPMYQKSDFEKRKDLYSRTQRKRMGQPVEEGESPVAFYRTQNGYCGLFPANQQRQQDRPAAGKEDYADITD